MGDATPKEQSWSTSSWDNSSDAAPASQSWDSNAGQSWSSDAGQSRSSDAGQSWSSDAGQSWNKSSWGSGRSPSNFDWKCEACGFKNRDRNQVCGGEKGPLGCKAPRP